LTSGGSRTVTVVVLEAMILVQRVSASGSHRLAQVTPGVDVTDIAAAGMRATRGALLQMLLAHRALDLVRAVQALELGLVGAVLEP
jgi:hypothetical protein